MTWNRGKSENKKSRYQIASSSGAWRKCGLEPSILSKIVMSQQEHILLAATTRQYLETHRGISRRFISKSVFLSAFHPIVDHESSNSSSI
jgi:hypothetical protein